MTTTHSLSSDTRLGKIIGRTVGRSHALLVLLLFSGTVAAQGTQNQFWPELAAYVRMSADTRLYFMAAPSIGHEDSFSELQYGAHVELGIMPIVEGRWKESHDVDRFRYLRFRLGLRHGTNLESGAGKYREWRVIVEITPRYFLVGLLATLRNRIDLRWVDGVFSWRYRPRLKFEWETSLIDWLSVVPWLSGELYYDSKFKSLSRTRYEVGVAFPVKKTFALDVYFHRHKNLRSEPVRVNALGLRGTLYF